MSTGGFSGDLHHRQQCYHGWNCGNGKLQVQMSEVNFAFSDILMMEVNMYPTRILTPHFEVSLFRMFNVLQKCSFSRSWVLWVGGIGGIWCYSDLASWSFSSGKLHVWRTGCSGFGDCTAVPWPGRKIHWQHLKRLTGSNQLNRGGPRKGPLD